MRSATTAWSKIAALGVSAGVVMFGVPVGAAPAEGDAAVLLLDGDEPAAAAELTDAIEREIEARGIAAQRGSSAGELVIALDCGDLDAACLGRAASQMRVSRIFYGTAELRGDAPKLSVHMYSTSAGAVMKDVVVPIDGTTDAARTAAARDAIATLVPTADDTPPNNASPVADAGPAATASPDPKDRRGKLVWGAYSPRPAWKQGLLGASVAVAAIGLGLGVVLGIPAYRSQQRKGRLYGDLIDAANRSLVDDDAELDASSTPGFNDVDPALVQEICSDEPGSGGALEVLQVTGGGKDAVRNADVAKECRKGQAYAMFGTVGWAMFGVGVLATAFSTTLFFVRRRGSDSAWHRRGVAFGVTATRRSAFAGGGFRF